MQKGESINECFDPAWSSAVPLSPTDFGCVIDEINATCKKAYPTWKRRLPLWCVPTSFLSICLCGALIAAILRPLDSNWPKEVLAVAILMTTFAMFFSRWLKSRMKRRMLAALRRHLCELNGRYIGRGVDFQLHESKHLDLYFRAHLGCEGSDERLHHGESSDYILVVQSIIGNDKRIPAPENLRAEVVTQIRQPSTPLVATLASQC